MRKKRLRGIEKLKQLVEEQNKTINSHRYEVVSFKGIQTNINKRQGVKSGYVASQKRTRAEKKLMNQPACWAREVTV